MAHNGGRVQANGGALQFGGGFELKNHWLQNQGWANFDNSGTPAASRLDPNHGYPLSIPPSGAGSTGVYSVFWVPTQAKRPGNWHVGWLGTGTILGGGTPITGADNGTDGSFTCVPPDVTGRTVLGVAATDAIDPIRKIWFVHEGEIAEYLVGENPWSTKFLQQIA